MWQNLLRYLQNEIENEAIEINVFDYVKIKI